jgi:hypothetical protein
VVVLVLAQITRNYEYRLCEEYIVVGFGLFAWLALLFPDFGLSLDHTVVREGEAQVRTRAWVP